MKFQRKKVATALGYVLGVGGSLLLAGMPAYAQDIKVDVTGSNIKRVEGEGAQPVQVFTRDDIQKTGVTTAADLLDRISANLSYNNYNETLALGDAGQPGFAGASLRGLGYDKTLVLLNGRRVANYAFNGAGADLNSIPLAAIERVEILKDGASAVYGTDAIGGVINFILRKDFQGVEVYGYYGDSDRGGGETKRVSVTGGWGNLARDRFNAFLTYDWYKNDEIKASQRGFASTAYIPREGVDKTSGNSFPANVTIPGVGSRNPLNPQCLPPFSFPTTRSPRTCRFDYASVIDILDPSERQNVLGAVTFQLTPNTQLFAEGSYSKNEYTFRVSPTPISNATTFNGDPFLLQPTSPFYPLAWLQANFPNVVGKPINIAYRSLELGPRTNKATSEQTRGVFGVQGSLMNWDYSAVYNHNESKAEDKYIGGWLRESVILPLLNSGVVNPFGFNTPEVVAQMQKAVINEVVRTGKGTVDQFEAKASRELFNLPAGALAMAIGGEYRKEKLQQVSAPVLGSGDILGGGGDIPSVDGDRKVKALYAEFSIPIIKTLEGTAAIRYDHYSDFGSTTNPKLALRWQPSKSVLVRGSWGTGFHAPTLQQLFQPQLRSNTANNQSDPLRCPITHDETLDCNKQFNSIQGGNPKLDPEKSNQWQVGVIWEPVSGLSLGADYWYVDLKGAIGTLTDDTIFSDLNRYAGNIVRGPVDPNFPNLPGPITGVVQINQNLGRYKYAGVDVDFQYRFPMTSVGQFKAKMTGTYLTKYEQQQDDGTFVGFIGQRSNIGAIPRWQHFATLDWTQGPWGATVAERYQHHYNEDDTNPTSPNTIRRVGSYTVFDLQGQYSGFKNTTLTLGVKNVFDRDPPFSNQGGSFQVGYDPSYVDPRGRFFYGSVRYTFGGK